MRILAALLSLLARLFRLLPLQERVALLSRQSSKVSLDYQLLLKALDDRLGPGKTIASATEPETKSVISFMAGTFKHLYLTSTSKVIIVDGYIPAVCIPKKDPRTTVIQTWHALGAIKKFGYQCLDTPAGRSRESAKIARMHRNYDYIIAGGPGAVPTFAEAFDYPENTVLPLGLPRTDYLSEKEPSDLKKKRIEAAMKAHPFLNDDKPVILYAPTLRKGKGYEDDWLTEYVQEVSNRYAGQDIWLLVAGHPLSKQANAELIKGFPFLRFSNGTPTIDLLPFADKVITDYSAVAFEAAALNKPVVFFTPDIKSYRQSPGLNIEPSKADAAFFKRYLGNNTCGNCTEALADLIICCLKN